MFVQGIMSIDVKRVFELLPTESRATCCSGRLERIKVRVPTDSNKYSCLSNPPEASTAASRVASLTAPPSGSLMSEGTSMRGCREVMTC